MSQEGHNRLSHDAFVRKIFSSKQVAIDYFKAYLPSALIDILDFETLKREPETYLSDDLKRSMSDIVYSCQRKDGRGSVEICLLIEHKSYLDKFSSIQLGKYIFAALASQILSGEPLSLIIPVLLYHGKESMKYTTLNDLYEKLDEGLKIYLPDFEYVFHDLGELDDGEVERLNNKFLAASFLALKYSFNKEMLEQIALKILLLSGEGSEGLQKSLIIYLFGRSKLDEEMLDLLPLDLKNNVMNTLDIYVEKGKKEGIGIGERLGLEKGERLGLEKGEKLGLEKGERLGLEKGEKLGLKKGEKLGLEKGEKLGLKKGERIRLKKLKITIENLIKNTDWNDQKIADITGEPLEFVQSIRASQKS